MTSRRAQPLGRVTGTLMRRSVCRRPWCKRFARPYPTCARRRSFALRSGLAEGDKVLRFPNATLKDGQEVQTAAEAKPSLVVEK